MNVTHEEQMREHTAPQTYHSKYHLLWLQLFTSDESLVLVISGTFFQTSCGLLLCSPCKGGFRRIQKIPTMQNQGRSQALLLKSHRSLDTAQPCKWVGKLTCITHTARYRRSAIVSSTHLAQNTVKADPEKLLWRKSLNATKGLPLVSKFLI